MTHIVGVRLINWQCFRGEHALDLQRGVYAVVAAEVKNSERSNWLGKSAFIALIRWVLDGAKPKGFASLDDLISHGEQEVGGDLELSNGVFISRNKRRGQSTQLKVIVPAEGFDGFDVELAQEEAQAEIWRRVGMPDMQHLLRTAWAEQDQMPTLLTLGSTELTEMFGEWLGLQKLEAAQLSAGKQLTVLEVERTAVEQRVRDVKEALRDAPDEAQLLARIAEEEDRHAQWQKQADAAKQRVLQLQCWEQRQALVNQVDRIKQESLAKQASLGLLGIGQDLAGLRETVEELKRESALADAAARTALSLVQDKFSGECPVNGRACPVAGEINAQSEPLRVRNEAALHTSRAKLSQLREAQTELVRLSSEEHKRETLRAGIQSLETQRSRLEQMLGGMQVVVRPTDEPIPPLEDRNRLMEFKVQRWNRRPGKRELQQLAARCSTPLRVSSPNSWRPSWNKARTRS